MLFALQIFGWISIATVVYFAAVYARNRGKPMPAPIVPCGRIHLGPTMVWGKGEGDNQEHFYQCTNCEKFLTEAEAATYISVRQATLIVMRKALEGARAK